MVDGAGAGAGARFIRVSLGGRRRRVDATCVVWQQRTASRELDSLTTGTLTVTRGVLV